MGVVGYIAYAVVAAVAYEEGVVKPKREATTAAEKQERKQQELLDKRTEQERINDLELERDKKRAARNSETKNASGRASTILTSPLGLPGSTGSSGRTILGS